MDISDSPADSSNTVLPQAKKVKGWLGMIENHEFGDGIGWFLDFIF